MATESPTPTKYRNVPTNGFASKREAKRAELLQVKETAGLIRNLRTQVRYLLVPRQLDERGKVAERAVEYVADFVYEEPGPGGLWHEVVEDAKGVRDAKYIVKRKLMRFTHGIVIREV